jgi:hypothetical protein
MFECLVGYPPFCSESTHETYQKIIQWQYHLAFPDDVHLSREAEDLVRRYVFLKIPDDERRWTLTAHLQPNNIPGSTVKCRADEETPILFWC